MHTGKYYRLRQALIWTKRQIVIFTIIAFTPTFLYEIAGFKFLTIPWLPVALIGTALAFVIGFKNNASYDRLWEARKIWGATENPFEGGVNDIPLTAICRTIEIDLRDMLDETELPEPIKPIADILM